LSRFSRSTSVCCVFESFGFRFEQRRRNKTVLIKSFKKTIKVWTPARRHNRRPLPKSLYLQPCSSSVLHLFFQKVFLEREERICVRERKKVKNEKKTGGNVVFIGKGEPVRLNQTGSLWFFPFHSLPSDFYLILIIQLWFVFYFNLVYVCPWHNCATPGLGRWM